MSRNFGAARLRRCSPRSRASRIHPSFAEAAGGVKTPAFERVHTPNGVVLLLMERHDVPLIAFNAVVRGGAATDPEEGSGAASILAGLLEKGAGGRDAFAFAQTVASVGGQIETGATTETISIRGSFLARDQKLMVELLADMLQRPQLGGGSVRRAAGPAHRIHPVRQGLRSRSVDVDLRRSGALCGSIRTAVP